MSDILSLENIKKYYLAEKIQILDRLFGKKPIYVKALDNVSISVEKGTILAVVGESGSGKTTMGKLISTIEEPTDGKIYFENIEVSKKNINEVRKKTSMVFQNPAVSVNPRMKIKSLVSEPLGHFDADQVRQMLKNVGLDYDEIGNKEPKELSGGQVQRVAIARAIIKRPELIVLDEPTSALDESIQAQILNLLIDLQKEYNLTYIFITHNIGVAKYISDKIAVIYAGKIVEYGDTKKVIENPKHPYTQLLLSSVPSFETKELKSPTGGVPSLINLPAGCRFSDRCPFVMDICKTQEPGFIDSDGVKVLCWLYGSS
ncbi:ABC transporter ATP-binding protein [Picrophilus oshimae]|uniref:Dipeptide ABC transporter Dpp1, ATP binding protein n=1 Tax=Picrophilus torridus (strain ATCC 700027 / DSM 9790 / JCM 10055 / NBRC 100828 / KAW 2/3) TaxID=1122961 RepID=Q6L2K3_PICTO|nr:ABC transporter ATP-binding protein [Picrophilus oshimae]AAT42799.1 dipeptide ABC transporter Dpp1, ATP binding protein [Picrophilus oshimae DSM 9789]SMD31560.1 peptide/nickel transport system ATP-binding protein [Picrophilus oshimae DSM 9789]